mmetsp:Transcript_16286/g.25528  ORF Transcript_16286/g.25528 Transcript_16286/m.25528 type:complete len:337 (+) Transcript_16286:267-1277(+)
MLRISPPSQATNDLANNSSTFQTKHITFLFRNGKSHGHLRRLQCPLRNLVRCIRTLLQNAPKVLLVGPDLRVTLLDRLQVRHHRLGKHWLEITPLHILHLLHNILPTPLRLHRRVYLQQISRLGPVGIVPLDPRQTVRLAPLDLIANHLGRVQNVDPRSVRGIRLGHLVRAVREAHDARAARLDDHGLGFGEGGEARYARLLASLFVRAALAVFAVESTDDVACQFEVLALILADRDAIGLVEEDVGCHEDGVGEEADSHGFGACLFGLVFELDHAFEPVHGRGAVEEPGEFGMSRDVGLYEDFRFCGVDSCLLMERESCVSFWCAILWRGRLPVK